LDPLQVGDGADVEENGGMSDGGTLTGAFDWSRGAAILNTGAYDFAGSGVVHMTVSPGNMLLVVQCCSVPESIPLFAKQSSAIFVTGWCRSSCWCCHARSSSRSFQGERK